MINAQEAKEKAIKNKQTNEILSLLSQFNLVERAVAKAVEKGKLECPIAAFLPDEVVCRFVEQGYKVTKVQGWGFIVSWE